MQPQLSKLYQSRQPSAVRLAQMAFAKRTDEVTAVNCSIGNVSLPTHPLIQQRMFALNAENSPFKQGVVKYTATVGSDDAIRAMKTILQSSGLNTDGLCVQVTDGGSAAMELMIVGVCGEAGSGEKPLLVLNPAYSNYRSLADRTGRRVVAVNRELRADGSFALPDLAVIEAKIKAENPGALVVIPYDNPTGQLFDKPTMVALAKLCVQYNVWMVSDEAYRELGYEHTEQVTSIWSLTESDVPGITGRRMSIESTSKVWNGCGLRIGWLVTDSQEFHDRAVAENTANLCPPAIDQYIVGALAEASPTELQSWYQQQRAYYAPLMQSLTDELTALLPGVIVSKPSASLYSVIDVRQLVDERFDAEQFVLWCATEGKVVLNSQEQTLLVAPMAGFYELEPGEPNPGRTQMRIAYVETPDKMALVPKLFTDLFMLYKQQQGL